MTGMIHRNAELRPIRPVGPGNQFERLARRPLTPHRAEHRMLAGRLRAIDAFPRAHQLRFKDVA
jgi:hypothetical protein